MPNGLSWSLASGEGGRDILLLSPSGRRFALPMRGPYAVLMARLWREFVDLIDANISVKETRFLRDIRAFLVLPLVPFLIAFFFVEAPSTFLNILGLLTLAFEVPWVILILRRRAAKKRDWIEPHRFTDDNNGY